MDAAQKCFMSLAEVGETCHDKLLVTNPDLEMPDKYKFGANLLEKLIQNAPNGQCVCVNKFRPLI